MWRKSFQWTALIRKHAGGADGWRRLTRAAAHANQMQDRWQAGTYRAFRAAIAERTVQHVACLLPACRLPVSGQPAQAAGTRFPGPAHLPHRPLSSVLILADEAVMPAFDEYCLVRARC